MKVISFAVGYYKRKLPRFCEGGEFVPGNFIQSTFPGGSPNYHVEDPQLMDGCEVVILGSMLLEDQDAMRAIAVSARDHGARRITYVYDYFWGSRKDRQDVIKDSQKLDLSDCVTADRWAKSMGMWPPAGLPSRHLVVDIHNDATLKSFSLDSSNSLLGREIEPDEIFSQIVRRSCNDMKLCRIVSADHGRHWQVRRLAKRLGCEFALVNAVRSDPSTKRIEEAEITGSVKGCQVFIREDILASGDTCDQAANYWLRQGAASVDALITHADFSPGGVERMSKSRNLRRIHITDSFFRAEDARGTSRFVIHETGFFLGKHVRENYLQSA